jgi:hypothetical protein
MNKKHIGCGMLLALTLGTFGFAQAGIVFQPGNDPQANEENIVFNGAGTISGPALTITGRTNQSDTLVAFTSSENLITPASGQARVEAQDGAFRDLAVYLLDGGTFGDLIFNLNTPNGEDGVAHITVHRLSGADLSYDFNVGNGGNFLTIFATAGDRMTRVDIDSNVGMNMINIDDGRQFRISDIEEPTNVPEPASLGLFFAGLLGMSRLRRKASDKRANIQQHR